MRDPSLALWLYIAIVAVQLLFSKRWAAFYTTIAEAGKAKATEAGSGNVQDSGAGKHGL
jgi:hypothetical protein